jgi:hypothetical protein
MGTFKQDESDTFSRSKAYSTYQYPELAEAGDLNGDGLKDIIVDHVSYRMIDVYIQGADHSLNTGTINKGDGVRSLIVTFDLSLLSIIKICPPLNSH